MTIPAQDTPAAIRRAIEVARSGDLARARRIGEQALLFDQDNPPLRAMLGMLCCQMQDFQAGVIHLRLAHRTAKADVTIACNLVAALIETHDFVGALEICTVSRADSDASRRIWRLRGYVLQQQEDFAAAAAAYRRVVERVPEDFESWNNLGNASAAIGDVAESIAALRTAASLRADNAPVRLNLAASLIAAEAWNEAIEVLQAAAEAFPKDAKPHIELCAVMKQLGRDPEALAALEVAARLSPDDPDLQVKLGIERIIGWKMATAETAFRRAIELSPGHRDAHVLLGVLLEHVNRPKDLAFLIDEARGNGIEAGAIDFIRALVYRRERRFEEGLAALANVPDDVEPVRKAQLAGQFHDRLGDVDSAFASFTAMNHIHAEDPSQPIRRAAEYRAGLAADHAILSPEWYRRWQPFVPDDGRKAPTFLVGFPRSGTTLLDTMLMGHPSVQVMEELPPLTRVEQVLGAMDRLADIDDAEINRLRSIYFDEVARHIDLRPDAMLVDKFPLHLNKVPIIHRLFPDARFILALRHPCDVLLSCFMTNFRLNNAMVNFLDLDTAAWVYDRTFSFWENARAMMPIDVHTVRYEDMVEDVEGNLRPLFAFLDLDWDAGALDHQRTANSRGTISTASYSQVTEPIYRRAAGRWLRYRNHLEPIMPTLQPWLDRFGYGDMPH